MKKILHVLAQRPGRTGSGIYLNSILHQADKCGYHQAVIVGIPKEERIEFKFHGEISVYPVLFETQELPFPVVGMSDVMPYKSTRYQDLTKTMYEQWRNSFSKTVLKAFAEFKPDLILCHHLWLLSSLVKKLLPKVFVIGISHGTGLRQLQLASQFKEEVISGCRKLDMIFAPNNFQKEAILDLYGIDQNRIMVVGNGFNHQIFYNRKYKLKGKTQKRILYVGKLCFSKGVKSLLNAFKMVETHSELLLIGSGAGCESDEIKKMAKKIENVSFTGAISQKELAEFFWTSDLFVLPSFYEGLPLVVIEALACGIPVVCTNLPGLKEWLGDKILKSKLIHLVPLPRLKSIDEPLLEDIPAFENDLQKAILYQLRQKPSETQFDTVQNEIKQFTWEGIFNKIEKIIAEKV